MTLSGLEGALSAIGPGDTSGSETFARYLYQCKVGVQRWLETIKLSDDAFVLWVMPQVVV